MNCQDVRKFSFTYLDGEFDNREQVEFESHLGMCGDCRQLVDVDASFRDVVRLRLSEATPACDLRDRLNSRLLYERRKTRVTWTLGGGVALAASVTLVAVTWQMLPDEGPTGPVATAGAAIIGTSRTDTPAEAATLAGDGLASRGADPKRSADGSTPMARRGSVQAVAVAGIGPSALRRARAGEGRANGTGHLRLASAAPSESDSAGEVLGGGLDNNLLTDKSPFGAVRSIDGLRAMIRAHAAPLPPEVVGPMRRVHAYLERRIADIGPPPIAEGAGVHLLGARLGQLGDHPVVQYSYRAWGVPLSAIVHLRAQQPPAFDDPSIVSPSPGDPRSLPSGLLLDRFAGYYLLHLVSERRVVTVISELGLPALQRLVAPQSFL